MQNPRWNRVEETQLSKREIQDLLYYLKAPILLYLSSGIRAQMETSILYTNEGKGPSKLGCLLYKTLWAASQGEKTVVKRLVLICPQENPTKRKNKESGEPNPPFFLSSSNTICIDSIGSFPGLRLRNGIYGMT